MIKKEKASVTVKKTAHEVDAEVRLDLLPDAGIHVYTSLPKLLSREDCKALIIAGTSIHGFPTKVSPSFSNNQTDLVWALVEEPIIIRGDQDTKISSVIFHIFNYIDFLGTSQSVEPIGRGAQAIQHMDLKNNKWNIEIKSLLTTRDVFNALKAMGGYGMTHVGSLRKEDGSSFNGKTAEEMLNALRFFLSLSKGMWCNPCLAVGFDDKENRVWEAWASPQGHWASPLSWFDPHHCDDLVNLFPGFISKWENEDWRKALHEVIYWYLSSNCSTLGRGINIDAGIILTQAAIERLSFEYAVRQKRLVEANGFKDLRASDKFRLLFSSLDIPIDIPASVPELKKLAKQFKWIDAPQAITEIRNSLVHPEHKRRGQFGKAFYPAWNLGQWYLELALLRICGYSGTYGNRLIQRWVGEVEPVPWSNNILTNQ